jgi:hypothetical protein
LHVTEKYGGGIYNKTSNEANAAYAPDARSDIDNWVQLVATHDGESWRIYRNGVLAGSAPSTAKPFTLNGYWEVGADAKVDGAFFHGDIDDVRIYRRALPADEVADLYQATAPAAVPPKIPNRFRPIGGATTPNAELDQDFPRPVHQWTFNDGAASDSVGKAHGTLSGGASIQDGRLMLDGSEQAVMRTAPIALDIHEKTLVSWVRLDGLDQRGGSVLTLQSDDGRVFDAIVFGERTPRQWMAGSDYFKRSPENNSGKTESDAGQTVMLAIAYNSKGAIVIYRDGEPYASYRADSLPRFAKGSAHALFGQRHTGALGGDRISGAIDEARIYAAALTAAQVKTLFRHGPVK